MKQRNEKVINPKTNIYLFSKEVPQGEIFSFVGGKESEEYKAMIESGWFDTPEKLNLPKDNSVGLTVDQVEKANPSHLKIMLEKIGFIVLTPEQMKAEVNKLIDTVIDIKEFTDEALLNEAVRRGLKEGEYIEDDPLDDTDGIVNTTDLSKEEIEALSRSQNKEPTKAEYLLEEFQEKPTQLTKEELVYLGNTMFKLGLRESMLEATLIAKITEAINNK